MLKPRTESGTPLPHDSALCRYGLRGPACLRCGCLGAWHGTSFRDIHQRACPVRLRGFLCLHPHGTRVQLQGDPARDRGGARCPRRANALSGCPNSLASFRSDPRSSTRRCANAQWKLRQPSRRAPRESVRLRRPPTPLRCGASSRSYTGSWPPWKKWCARVPSSKSAIGESYTSVRATASTALSPEPKRAIASRFFSSSP